MPSKAQPQSDLLAYHRPKLRLSQAPYRLKRESVLCLKNLSNYKAPPSSVVYPRARCAAVLVALFGGRMGDLYVLLSRRAMTLRTYAGDTSLPGGKYEPDDRTLEDTARREAYEEIGLPPDKTKVPLLCILKPFLAGNHLIVTPVVVMILDNTLTPLLNADEVTSLFSHPLRSFLSSDPPFPGDVETLEFEYHTTRDVPWEGDRNRTIRMHRFLTGREAGGTKPVYGLTAAIMIRTATIGFAQYPLFKLESSSQPSMSERLGWVFANGEVFRKAMHEEGIDPDQVILALTKERRQKGASRSMGRTTDETKARL